MAFPFYYGSSVSLRRLFLRWQSQADGDHDSKVAALVYFLSPPPHHQALRKRMERLHVHARLLVFRSVLLHEIRCKANRITKVITYSFSFYLIHAGLSNRINKNPPIGIHYWRIFHLKQDICQPQYQGKIHTDSISFYTRPAHSSTICSISGSFFSISFASVIRQRVLTWLCSG